MRHREFKVNLKAQVNIDERTFKYGALRGPGTANVRTTQIVDYIVQLVR